MKNALPAAFLLCVALNAQQAEVRHKHVMGGSKATMQVTPEGITMEESGKNTEHTRKWAWKDIQEAQLGDRQLRIETYEDAKTNSARGREYLFDRLPKEFVDQIRPVLRRNLSGRFIDAGPLKESRFENR